MGARTKLNAAVIRSIAVIAAIIGLSFGSWTAFLIASAILAASAIHSGDLRPHRSATNRR